MAFQDDLRTYLDRLALRGVDPPRSWFDPDVRLHRQHLLRELERLEVAGKSKQVLEYRHVGWSSKIAEFARKLGTELVNGLCHRQPSEVTNLINIAISRKLGLEASTGSFIKDSELDRLSREPFGKSSEDEQTIEQYALEIRAVRRVGERRQPTPLGRIALELPDRDVLRWLLTAEAVQSRGTHDPWRLSRSAAAQLHTKPCSFSSDDPEDVINVFPASWMTALRLSKMGILSLSRVEDEDTGQPFGDNYEVVNGSLPLLEEIAFRPDTPFAVLIEALLSDETDATIAPLRPATMQVPADSAAIATTRHARMVTHEIRNALVPVQGAVEQLYRDAERQGAEALLTKHRESIDQGIERIFQFVKDMMEVAERGVEPPESFEVDAVIQEAIATIAQQFGRLATFTPTPDVPLVKGYRHRFMLVMVNLIRNAAQTNAQAAIQIHVRTQLAEQTGDIVVIVEDDGPGVAQEHRTNIFKQGFSLRAGGTGQGLALVRDVIEAEMGGVVVCEDSSLGGARFVVKLPVTERQSR